MLIQEIPVEASIQIVVGIGLQTMEFATTVKEVHEMCVYAEPLLQDGKMLGFGTKGLVLTLIVTDPEGGRAWQFTNVKIRNIKTQDGSLYHEISCKTEGKLINRRGACRVWLGEPGTAMVGLGGKPFDVTVKDISVSGIAFICSKDQDIPEGSIVHIQFHDADANTRFDMKAIIVRSEEMEKSRMLYGCKLNQESAAISRYVNDKQREKLKAARQTRVRPLTGSSDK